MMAIVDVPLCSGSVASEQVAPAMSRPSIEPGLPVGPSAVHDQEPKIAGDVVHTSATAGDRHDPPTRPRPPRPAWPSGPPRGRQHRLGADPSRRLDRGRARLPFPGQRAGEDGSAVRRLALGGSEDRAEPTRSAEVTTPRSRANAAGRTGRLAITIRPYQGRRIATPG